MDLLLWVHTVVERTTYLIFRIVILQNKSMELTKMRAARSFVLFRPIVSLYFGVLSAVAVGLAMFTHEQKKVPILSRDVPFSRTETVPFRVAWAHGSDGTGLP